MAEDAVYTLTEAAQALCESVEGRLALLRETIELTEYGEGALAHIQDIEPYVARLRAALAAHDTPPPICDECGADVLEQCLCPPFDTAAEPHVHVFGPSGQCDCGEDRTSYVESEGTDVDDLLASADAYSGSHLPGEWLVRNLASALRSQRDETERWKGDAKRYARKAEVWHDRVDEWQQIVADYRRGTVTVTDDMLDSWIESLRSGNAVVFGPPQANGLADRLDEVRAAQEKETPNGD